jgi:DNA-directed RNA polymerase subunit beta
MTNRGHFVFNGSPRVIIHQLVRSPGIYFRENKHEVFSSKWSEKPTTTFRRFYADIICAKGTWLRIETEKDFSMWAKMKKGPKIPLLWFLLGMGLSEKYIFNSVSKPTNLFESFRKEIEKGNKFNSQKDPKYSYVSNPKQAWEQIQKLLKLKKTTNKSIISLSEKKKKDKKDTKNIQQHLSVKKRKIFPSAQIKKKMESYDLGRKWFFNKFMNPQIYDLGKQGRLSINKKLGLTIPAYQTTLTALDLLLATDYLMKMQDGVYEVDDIDHLKNKRVRSSGECLQEIFSIGFLRLEKSIRLKLNSINTKTFDIVPTATSVKTFDTVSFSSTSPSDVAEMPNPALAQPDQSPPMQTGQKRTGFGFAQLLVDPSNRRGFGSIALHQQQISANQKGNSRFSQQSSTFHFQSLLNTRPINGAFREFFGTHPLSQFMDQINPLAEITHKRRLTSLGPGGVSRDTATLAIRGIHPSHYGRICPIETPEGKNTGLVNSLTTYAKLSSSGLLKSPFYKVLKGQIQKNSGVFFLDPEQEEHFRIATPDLKSTPLGFLPKNSVPIRIGKRFIRMKTRQFAFIGVSPLQMISIATSFIPFLEHDDANRALMGSNMQRQAVPVLRPERPFLGTGLETRVISDSGHAVFAKKSGYVISSSGSSISIYLF